MSDKKKWTETEVILAQYRSPAETEAHLCASLGVRVSRIMEAFGISYPGPGSSVEPTNLEEVDILLYCAERLGIEVDFDAFEFGAVEEFAALIEKQVGLDDRPPKGHTVVSFGSTETPLAPLNDPATYADLALKPAGRKVLRVIYVNQDDDKAFAALTDCRATFAVHEHPGGLTLDIIEGLDKIIAHVYSTITERGSESVPS